MRHLELIEELSKLGKFALRNFDDGTWLARLTFPNPVGIIDTVSSGYDCKTYGEALEKLYSRLGQQYPDLTKYNPLIEG